jgi:putative ABC transport system substrate-binding protein
LRKARKGGFFPYQDEQTERGWEMSRVGMSLHRVLLSKAVFGLLSLVMLVAMGQSAQAAGKVGILIPRSSGVVWEYEEAYGRHIGKHFKVPEELEVFIKETLDDRASRMKGLRELLENEVEMLIVFGSSGALEASTEFEDLPIVFIGSYDPVEMGLVKSLKKPGGNVTGVTGTTILAVLIEAVLEVTEANELGVLYNSDNKDSVAELHELEEMSKKTSFTLRPIDLQGLAIGETPQVFEGTEFILMTTGCCNDDQMIFRLDKLLKPVACWTPTSLCDGAVFSYTLDLEDTMLAVADLTKNIVAGGRPARLPVRIVKKRRFVIDMQKANQLSLDIPFSVFKHATSVSK